MSTVSCDSVKLMAMVKVRTRKSSFAPVVVSPFPFELVVLKDVVTSVGKVTWKAWHSEMARCYRAAACNIYNMRPTRREWRSDCPSPVISLQFARRCQVSLR